MKKNVHIRPDGQNTTPVIYEILAGIGPEEEAILEFERGTYYFYRDGSKLFTSILPEEKARRTMSFSRYRTKRT